MPSINRVPVILLVEDSDDDAYFFKRTLKKSGTDQAVIWLQDGRAAIDYLEEHRPDIVFLDLKLPALTGFDVLQWLAARAGGDDAPVIVLSGSDHAVDIDRAIALGARGYLVKPVNLPQLQMLLGDHAPLRNLEVPL